jgi:hypothetical protein
LSTVFVVNRGHISFLEFNGTRGQHLFSNSKLPNKAF